LPEGKNGWRKGWDPCPKSPFSETILTDFLRYSSVFLTSLPTVSLTLNFIFGRLLGCESTMRETHDLMLQIEESDLWGTVIIAISNLLSSPQLSCESQYATSAISFNRTGGASEYLNSHKSCVG
jgi:hypothetical protein